MTADTQPFTLPRWANGVQPSIDSAITGVDFGGAVLVFAPQANLACSKFQLSSINRYDLAVSMRATAEEENHEVNPHR